MLTAEPAMRLVLIMLAVFAVQGWAEEKFTLADGRELIGTYDEAKHLLSVITPNGRAVIEIKPEQIKLRATVTAGVGIEPPTIAGHRESAPVVTIVDRSEDEKEAKQKITLFINARDSFEQNLTVIQRLQPKVDRLRDLLKITENELEKAWGTTMEGRRMNDLIKAREEYDSEARALDITKQNLTDDAKRGVALMTELYALEARYSLGGGTLFAGARDIAEMVNVYRERMSRAAEQKK